MKHLTIWVVTAWAAQASVTWGADALDVWTVSDSGTPDNLNAVAYGNGQFVAVGDPGAILTSTDGVSWTKRDSGTSISLKAVTFGGGQYVAVGGESPRIAVVILSSRDGVKWTQHEAGTANALYGITYGNGRFVAVGGASPGAATIVSSIDGVTWTLWKWTPNDIDTDPPGLTGVAFGNGQFLAVYRGGPDLFVTQGWTFTSTNGIDWTQLRGPTGVRAVTYGNGLFVGAGGFVAFENRHYIGHGIIYSSTDGINWTLRVDDTTGDSSTRFNSIAYGAGQFVAVGTGTYTSADGTNWIGRGATIPSRAIGYGNNYFISMGDAGYITRSSAVGKLGASLAPNGPFLGTITGVNGQNYSIQSSTNLGEWLDLTSVTISNGIGQFSDSAATNSSQRFYKAIGIFQ